MSMNQTALVEMKQGLESARQRWDELDALRLHHVEKIWNIVVKQGEILQGIHKQHGRPGINAFCELVGKKQAQAYNYMKLYEHKDNPFLRQLSQDKTLALLPAVEDDDAQVLDNKIILGNGMELTMDDAQKFTREDLMEIARTYKKQKRLQADLEKALDETRDMNNKEIDELRKQVEEKDKRLRALIADGDIDPVDALVEEADRAAVQLGKLLQRCKESELNADQAGRIQGIFAHIHEVTIHTNPMADNF